MSSLSIPYSFTNGTTANATEVNANFSAVKNFVETQLVQSDGTVKANSVAIQDDAVTAAKIADATLKLLCPVGTIIAYANSSAPPGWLLCNGTAINGAYAELISIVGANTPNLSGKFPIGSAGNLTLQGSGGSTTISLQNLPSHTHTVSGGAHTHIATDSGHSHWIDGRADDATTSGAWYPSSEQTTQPVNQVPTAAAFANITVTTTNSEHVHAVSYAGADAPYYPPFYVVNFIIKHDYV